VKLFLSMEKILWISPLHDHLFLTEELPKGIMVSKHNNGGRPMASIRSGTGDNTIVMATAVVLFCRPTKCQTTIGGRPCNRRHRTVYDFVEHHTGQCVNDVHISHICHHHLCLQRKHLIFEPAAVNLRRNSCRIECSCGARPPCFTSFD